MRVPTVVFAGSPKRCESLIRFSKPYQQSRGGRFEIGQSDRQRAEIFCDGGCFAKFLVRKQLHEARNRPTDATIHIDNWVVASYRTCDNRRTVANQL
jgi:hypothetical protein